MLDVRPRLATAPLPAAGLIAGYAATQTSPRAGSTRIGDAAGVNIHLPETVPPCDSRRPLLERADRLPDIQARVAYLIRTA